MAYWSNSTEHQSWTVENCNKCLNHYDVDPSEDHHDPNKNCPIELVHLLYNYDECNNDASILDYLIPRNKNGIGNGKCRMFRDENTGEYICDNCFEEYYDGENMAEWMEKQIQIVQEMNKLEEKKTT